MSCDKESYTKRQAQTLLNAMRKQKGLPKRPKRVYECPECKAWHITSKKRRNENPVTPLNQQNHED